MLEIERIPGDLSHLRVTITNADGDSISQDISLEEADELARRVIAMAGIRKLRSPDDVKIGY